MKRTSLILLIITIFTTAIWPVNGFSPSGLVLKADGLHIATYGNGVMTNITPDVRNRPDNWTTTIGVDDLINNDYVYDPFGNITDIGSEHFVYDNLNRLTNATGISSRNFTYGYDANGNVLSVAKTNPSESSSFTYSNNRLNGVTYDADGNLTDDGTYTYDYDQFGQMTSSGTDSYTYDALGKRILKTSGTSSLAYCYLGEQLISTYDENLLSYYDEIYLEGQLLARVVDDGVSITDVTNAHLNHLGSPVAFTDDAGAIVWPGQSGGTPYEVHSYEPFGADFADLGSQIIEQDVRFTGKLFDASTEKHYFNARYYNGITTDASYEMPPRFLSPDVINGNPDNGQSWNRYGYCLNNPVNMVDPDGNYEVPVIWHPWDKFSDLPYDIFGVRSMIDISTSINGASAKSMQVSVKGSPAVSTSRAQIGATKAGVKSIADNAFVRVDATRFDKSISELGIQHRFFSDNKVWMTQYKYVKGVTDPAAFETMLYRQNLWNGTRGRFADGVTIRMLNNIDDAVPAGLTNMKNGVPQWRITRDIPPMDILIVDRLR